MGAILGLLGLGPLASRVLTWALAAIALAAAVGAAVWAVNRQIEAWREEGRAEVRAEWKAADERARIAAERVGRDLFIHMERASADLVAKKARERVITRKIIEKVPVYVPVDAPIADLPRDDAVRSLAGLVLIHDAAASGTDPGAVDPAGALEAARAVVPSHFARVLAGNLGECREAYAQIDVLISTLTGTIEAIKAYNATLEGGP